ncbi:minor tail protein [Bacillus phage Wes44]|uniref:DUF2479 domain-containing protein n=1 Tax=Bacillus phage Wes44 TaxID=2283012 RepID=A0A346FK41_9CAUD|nr:minor tail protein [Bacillus phage Wes44]AXN58346.1 DUF2479 domain-containing protein [Bacillus phage Wes44]
MANNIFKRKEITLDTFNDLNKEMIASFSQGDRISDKLIIRLTNDKDGSLDLTDAVQVRIDFRKPDGKLVFQYCNMEDKPNGLISAILTTQTLAAPGKVYAEVTVKYPEGKDAVTRQFTFWVQDAIASDKSIESQNEWPMLERAIVAGDMLAGVDLVAIIQAGELAKGAVKKTGDTMTGDLTFDTKAGQKRVRWTGTNTDIGLSMSDNAVTQQMSLYDFKNSKEIFNYNPLSSTFNLGGAMNTNLLRKTGDTMTGNFLLDRTGTANTNKIAFSTAGVEELNLYQTGDGYYGLRDVKGNQGVWDYNRSNKTFNVTTDTNLVKKTGDTVTGAMTFNQVLNLRSNFDHTYDAGGLKGVTHVINNSTDRWAMGPKTNGTVDWSKEISLNLVTGLFTVSALATKLDGTTNITLSSEATAPDVNYPLQAVRRNSTVMLKGAFTLNANATGVIVATLPPELRPTTGNLSMYTPTADGTAMVQVFVNGTTGAVAVSSNGKGKRVDIVLTYVI